MAPKDAQQEKTARRSSKRLASEALDSGSSGPHKSMRTEPLAEETGGPKSSRASSSAADKQKETRETAAAAVAEEEEVEADAPAAAAAKGKGKGKGKKAPAAAAAKKGKDKGKGKASSKPTRNQPKRGGKQQPQQQEQEQSEAEEEEQELTGLDKEAAEKITTLPPDEYADWHVGHFYKPDIKLHRTPQHFYLHWEFARFRAIKAQGLPQDSDYLDPDDLFTHFTVEARWESKLTQDERNAFTAKAKSLWDEDVDESNGLIPTLSRAHAPVQPTASATTKPPRRAPAAPAVVPAEGAPGPATRTRAKKTESSQQAPESPTL